MADWDNLPNEERQELQTIGEEFRGITMDYACFDEAAASRDIRELSLDELNTRYQILFDMHQNLAKIKVRTDCLETFKQGRNYAPFIHTLDNLTASLSKQLEEILAQSFKKISDRGFL